MSKRSRIEGAIEIRRPVEVVFDTVADERNEPRYNPRLRHVEQLTPGRIDLGTRFHAEALSMGRSVPMTIEFTDFDRPRRLGSSTRMPAMDVRGVLRFDPTPAGTRLSWSWDIRPRGPLAILRPVLRPLVLRLGARQEQQIWHGLKRYLERPVDAARSIGLA